MNIIDAIIHLINNPMIQLVEHYQSRNRANQAGDALEQYIKDLFANSFHLTETERQRKHSQTFSYLGNSNNPPDAMLIAGDAIEVKKIENDRSALALNSSYPKAKLFANNPMISNACRQAENWTKKDIIYAVGVVKNNQLKRLAMVYGDDYCADETHYLRIKHTIKQGVENIQGVQFSETKELGRVNRVDPLGITYLRVRGMWGIENPWTVFNYLPITNINHDFHFMAIINEEKWHSLENHTTLLAINHPNLSISDVQIQNPNNPAQLKHAKLICFTQ